MDWGNVPGWVASILTGGSLLLGFYILLRDRQKEESSQARQIISWTNIDLGSALYRPEIVEEMKVSIHNTSNLPIRRVRITWGLDKAQRNALKEWIASYSQPSLDDREFGRWALLTVSLDDPPDQSHTLKANQSDELVILNITRPVRFYVLFLQFVDAAGVEWTRDVWSNRMRRGSHKGWVLDSRHAPQIG